MMRERSALAAMTPSERRAKFGGRSVKSMSCTDYSRELSPGDIAARKLNPNKRWFECSTGAHRQHCLCGTRIARCADFTDELSAEDIAERGLEPGKRWFHCATHGQHTFE
jgi:hypothetical protein